ncbi:MAG: hypothetical protein OXG33_04405 [Chloroflexi bacterium]|nr:hypothetical protein [Chloroflexota bacterium]
MRRQLADLQEQLSEYESLKAGNFEIEDLNVVAKLPATLVKARIS